MTLVVSSAVRFPIRPRHCEERSDVAIHGFRHSPRALDCRASLAMTLVGVLVMVLSCFLVIARSVATRQSIAPRHSETVDCHALSGSQ